MGTSWINIEIFSNGLNAWVWGKGTVRIEVWNLKIINKNRGWRNWYIYPWGVMDSMLLNALYQKASYTFVLFTVAPSPVIHSSTFSDFSCPKSTLAWKQMIHFLMYNPKVISSHHVSILLSYVITRRRVSIIQNSLRKKEIIFT